MYYNLLLPIINISYSQIIAMLLGETIDRVHIHNLVLDARYLKELQSLEVKRNHPLSYNDPEFKLLNTKWIYEPGVHIGIHQARKQIIFMLRIMYANII
jgi:hypothetical protein